MNSIETTALVKRFGTLHAVDDLNLTVAEGELFALLGVNGAGKTTAIRMLCGLSKPTSGEIKICGYDMQSERHAIQQRIALSPQETAVAPTLTAYENLALIAGAHGLSKKETEARIEELVTAFGLSPILKRRAGKLSGGWKRRLSIAMALISKPKVLFLDEPTLGLDVLARSELWELIRALRTTTTMMLTTHYMEEAEALADRVGIMQSGHLLTADTVEGLLARTGTDRLEHAFLRIVKEGAQ